MGAEETKMDADAWRAQVKEQAIDPGLPIIDTHHHIWPVAPFPGYEAYDDTALINDVMGSGHAIVATIAVEAHASYRPEGPAALRPVGETEHAQALAKRVRREGGRAAGICAAIVAHADLWLGAGVEAVLDAHRAAAPERLRGIRHMAAWDADLRSGVQSAPGMLADPAFREGFARLARHNLSFDAWVVHSQLGEVVDLARAFPSTQIILDHAGGPIGVGRFAGRPAESFAEWRAALAPLARCDNVAVKLGGLNISVTGLGAMGAARPRGSEEMAALHRDHILAAIDLFGPERAMFESNFPVDRMSGPYDVLWNGFKRITAGFTAAERAAMFAGTARRIYRIAAGEERQPA
jgi:predicted TIM-barrel fold metal-dependent hydrolase